MSDQLTIPGDAQAVQTAKTTKQSTAKLPRVIAISSGKGGVGKSSIAVNLGISLAKAGAKVCVFDADTGLANVNILLGMAPQYSLEHVLYGAKPIEDVMLDGPHGLKIIPGANGISECVTLHPRQQLRLTRELARIEGEFDYLLIDTAAGISSTTLDFVSASHHTMVVITPEPTSLTDAFSLIKLLKRRRSQIEYHVVVNMCADAKQAKEVFHRFSAAVEKYIGIEARYLGFIQRDESLRAAVALQNPVALFPDTDPSCRNFIRLADAVEAATADSPVATTFSSYWHRQYRNQRAQAGKPRSGLDDNPLASAPPTPSPTARDNDYLSELRSRILMLIEQGNADPEPLQAMLREGIDAFVQRFGRSPMDTLGMVEQAVATPQRDDHLLREIYEKVKPWGPSLTPAFSSEPFVSQPASPPAPPKIEVAAEPAADTPPKTITIEIKKSTEAPARPSYHKHRFDEGRFGSQDSLLDILQRQPSGNNQSLYDWLEGLA